MAKLALRIESCTYFNESLTERLVSPDAPRKFVFCSANMRTWYTRKWHKRCRFFFSAADPDYALVSYYFVVMTS